MIRLKCIKMQKEQLYTKPQDSEVTKKADKNVNGISVKITC